MDADSFSEPLPEVDWDNLQMVETHDDEGRIELMTEDQVYVLLGLRDEETAKLAAIHDQGGDNDGAAIHVSDAIPDEMVITYDKDHPNMDLGTMYPSMKDFRMAVRQFAINEEFDLGTEKSDKTRFRGFCKSSEDCPWRIVGSLQDDKSTVKVTVLVDRHDCTSSSRVKTITPSQNWVASKAVSILRDSPNMGAKELQEKLQKEHSVTILYDTVWRGREKALAEVYGKWEESFELLYRWKAEVMKRSPGSVVEIEVLEVDGNVYFHRFFCALKPCIDGFLEGCRPYLGIDSTALNIGRQRKLRIKGCLEGGQKKKSANNVANEGGVDGEGGDGGAPTNAKGKKMIRGTVTCKRCGEKGHRQSSYKCPFNGTKKRKRNPRKNVTKARQGEPSTPQRPTREQILQDSPGRVTRSRLAFLLGEGSSLQTSTISPKRMPPVAAPRR